MVQNIKVSIRITKEQRSLLEAKARASGYSRVSYYVRAVLFKSMPTEEKINAIYEKICKD
jgi:uncharacterized protein (DUF1778 family)